MKKNDNTIPTISAIIVVVCIVIAGYLVVGNPSASQTVDSSQIGLAQMVDGKQVIKMTVKSVSYDPNYFKVRVGVPVKWEITSSGQPGCANGYLLSALLPNKSLALNPGAGQVTVAEFTPQATGTYRFTCSMGMVVGKIEVVN